MQHPDRLRFVTCAHPGGLHSLAYRQWGDGTNPSVVVCTHGLTRNARDFDALAQRLSARHRVICPDMPGRGSSDWLSEPSFYAIPQYVADCVTLIARLDVPTVAWVGTSMGGLIGMALAALEKTPIARLVLNDIGPELGAAGVSRIGTHVGTDPTFATREEAEAYARSIVSGFGPHGDDEWRLLTKHYVVERDGAWKLHYDPAIAQAFKGGPAPVPLWGLYDRLTCPTLVLRGENSDILLDGTAQAMTERGPRAKRVEIAETGHAPSLVTAQQIDVIDEFLTTSTH